MPLDRTAATGPRRVPPPNRPQRHPSNSRTRWVALQNFFDPEAAHAQESHVDDLPPIPVMAFVSLAGGVGKTSLVASLGCLLAANGQSSLLVDTHIYGLLPLFFGARELEAGSARTFAGGANAAPVRIMTLDNASPAAGSEVDWMATQVAAHSDGMKRILIDVSTASIDLLRQVLRMSASIMIVLTPEMTSVVSLQAVIGIFEQLDKERPQPAELFFVLNQFDASLRLHLEVRDRLNRQLGKRLLPFVIHRSGAVSEALAEGMTIVDYAPDAQVVEDLGDFTQWIEALHAVPNLRWRER
jgi:cellulose synthase operon protein YhjQ